MLISPPGFKTTCSRVWRKIHELKVISRTSVMAYEKPGTRNIREIGRALGVANVLEGQRAA